MSETVDFAGQRAIRRPDELPFEQQVRMNQTLAELDTIPYVRNEGRGINRSFWLRDLGKRMLESFIRSGDKIAPAIRQEFNGLSQEDQEEVMAAVESFKTTEGSQ